MSNIPQHRINRKIRRTKKKKEIRIFSFGGGAQSTAVLAMQAMGMLDRKFDAFVFANVGNDSENPATIKYMEEYTRPFALKHAIPLIELNNVIHNKEETLLHYMYRTKRSIDIPVFLSGGYMTNRSCTDKFKIQVIDKWIRNNNWGKATVGLGISIDEFRRAKNERWFDVRGFSKRFDQPLLKQRIDRKQCKEIMMRAGLPEAPKSACWFCPVTQTKEWEDMMINNPDLFRKAVLLEEFLNLKQATKGSNEVFLHRKKIRLETLKDIPTQTNMFEDIDVELCGGFCGL